MMIKADSQLAKMQKIRDWKIFISKWNIYIEPPFPRLRDNCKTGNRKSKIQRQCTTTRKQFLQDTPAHVNSQWL